MNNFGFIKVAAAIPSVRVADCDYNAEAIVAMMHQAEKAEVSIVAFPELSITGYTCGDLFHNNKLIEKAYESMQHILDACKDLKTVGIVGLPVEHNNRLYNCAITFQGAHVLSIVPKTFLPNYDEFYEKRWFTTGADIALTKNFMGDNVPFCSNQLISVDGIKFGIEICEDLWASVSPSCNLATQGADVIFNISASNEVVGKHAFLCDLVRMQSARCTAGYVYASAGMGESSTDLVYAGNAIIAENGKILVQSKRFCSDEQLIISEIDAEKLRHIRLKHPNYNTWIPNDDSSIYISNTSTNKKTIKLTREINPTPFIPTHTDHLDEIFEIQATALRTRIKATSIDKMVIGISGGLDSTLALLACVYMCDKFGIDHKNIICVTMPGFGTTDRTYNNAKEIVEKLGATLREINISKACLQHFSDIEHDANIHDATYENTQARERTQILMDIANQVGGLVIGTGDLSELALGWATYNGDQMSMYGLNASIPKTLVRKLVEYAAQCSFAKNVQQNLLDIVATPVSPELLPADNSGKIAQKTEDLVGPYELHDFFLYHMVKYGFSPRKIYFLAQHAFEGEYDNATIKKWLKTFIRRFFTQQFKRSCMPDGPKVCCITLSPRGDWRMPSDASAHIWLDEVEKL